MKEPTRFVKWALSFLLFFAPFPTWAKSKGVSAADAPIVIDRGGSRRLFISGFAGQVNLLPNVKSSEVIIRATRYVEGDDAPTTTQQELSETLRQIAVKAGLSGGTVEIRTQLPPNRTQWAAWAKGRNMPQVKLDIVAPDSMNLEIYWARGDIKIIRWKAPVVITHQAGRLHLEDIGGDVVARTMYGSAKVENVRGSVSIESFASQLSLGLIAGKLKVRTFSGETQVRKISGSTIVSSQKAAVVLQDTQGPMEIQTGIATIQIMEHKGSLRGQSDTGAIIAKLLGPVDAHLNSNSGALSVTVPRSSRVDVVLASNKGDLKAPKNLEQKRTSAGKIIRGHLPGNEPGALRLNSDSGDINLKVL